MPEQTLSRWELAAETIAVKIRWFGLFFAYLLVNLADTGPHRPVLNAILFLGVGFALVDTAYSLKGRVFLHRWPLLISFLEAFFIALLCYFDRGLDSPFRFYYILSLMCCAIRYSMWVTYVTWALHSVSFTTLYFSLPSNQQDWGAWLLLVVILGWVAWACSALAWLLKKAGSQLAELNRALEEDQALLEARIAERTGQLQEAQAKVLHQEKMAAFGLLAAGIAHEVGNPLTSISTLVQMLKRREQDDYTNEKLALVSGQLQRIQTTLRELVHFSRPASTFRSKIAVAEVIQEALNIAKYYTRFKGRQIEAALDDSLPAITGGRDQLVQVFLNLLLNALDATDTGGRIAIRARALPHELEIAVEDNGHGIPPEKRASIFQPYFTTKKHGTGLGLFVTKKLVIDLAGRIEFTSEPGQGTTFVLRFPIAVGQVSNLPGQVENLSYAGELP